MTVIVTGLGMLVAAWSLLVRFGRAHGVERQRLRWAALAAVLTVVVVLGIAAAAAARRRIQAAVDRRFNRRRHDAAQRIAAFSGRLHQQVDLGTLTAELLAVVDLIPQPTTVSLWLRPPIDTTQSHAEHIHAIREPTAVPRAGGPDRAGIT
jgi:hypothetical protein